MRRARMRSPSTSTAPSVPNSGRRVVDGQRGGERRIGHRIEGPHRGNEARRCAAEMHLHPVQPDQAGRAEHHRQQEEQPKEVAEENNLETVQVARGKADHHPHRRKGAAGEDEPERPGVFQALHSIAVTRLAAGWEASAVQKAGQGRDIAVNLAIISAQLLDPLQPRASRWCDPACRTGGRFRAANAASSSWPDTWRSGAAGQLRGHDVPTEDRRP